MDDYVHFDGDPAVDSQRRHLERVIKGYPPRRRWPWIVAAMAGGGLWAAWRTVQRRQSGPSGDEEGQATTESSDPAARS
jgi:hypothetical protein